MQFTPHLPGEPSHAEDEACCEYQRDLLAVGLRNVQQFQEPFLGTLIETQDSFAPQQAQCIQAQPEVAEPTEHIGQSDRIVDLPVPFVRPLQPLAGLGQLPVPVQQGAQPVGRVRLDATAQRLEFLEAR